MFGYDYVLSIEHEDTLMSPDEGLTKAATFLNQIVIRGSADGAVVGVVRICSKSDSCSLSHDDREWWILSPYHTDFISRGSGAAAR